MKTQSNSKMIDAAKSSYLVIVIALLGVVAFISAVLIAWPAWPTSAPGCSIRDRPAGTTRKTTTHP